jgi:membrane protein
MRGLVAVLMDAAWRFAADDGWMVASHISLTILMSLFPLLIFVAAVAGFFGTQSLADEVARLIFGAWPAAVAGPVAQEVHNVLTQPRGGLLTFGAVFALYFASNAIEALRTGLNRAYHFTESRPWWLLRMYSIAFVGLMSLALLALAFLVVAWLRLWSHLVEAVPALGHFHGAIIGTLALCAPLFLAHRYLPVRHMRLRDIAPGVAVTLVCSIAFGWGFGVYLDSFPLNYASMYAGLGSIMAALVFLYSIAAIFVFGGELNAAILRARKAHKAA